MTFKTEQEVKVEDHILRVKAIRVELDESIEELRVLPYGTSREISLAITELQSVRHWLGEELGRLQGLGFGKPPYPKGNDPKTTEIDPPADKAEESQ